MKTRIADGKGKYFIVHFAGEIAVCIAGVAMLIMLLGANSCSSSNQQEPSSRSGVKAIDAEVQTNAEGITVEQENIRNRLKMDNAPGSVKHLYVISAYSGQVLIYSTVRGKVTSSGKRLSPTSVSASPNTLAGTSHDGFNVYFDGVRKRTGEVLQDDGTYGTSVPYLYWWDATGKYHQHYVSGGQILHISDQPVAVKSIAINMTISE